MQQLINQWEYHSTWYRGVTEDPKLDPNYAEPLETVYACFANRKVVKRRQIQEHIFIGDNSELSRLFY